MSTRKLLGIHSSLVSSKVSQRMRVGERQWCEFIWRYYHIFLSIWNSSLMRLSCVAAKQQIYSPFTRHGPNDTCQRESNEERECSHCGCNQKSVRTVVRVLTAVLHRTLT